jgi:hypothetical protein
MKRFKNYIVEQYGLRKKLNYGPIAGDGFGGPPLPPPPLPPPPGGGGHWDDSEYYDNEMPPDPPDGQHGSEFTYDDYLRWLHNLPPGGPIDLPDEIDVDLSWRFPTTDSGGEPDTEVGPKAKKVSWTNVGVKPEPPDPIDPTLFDNPYAYAGITNDYGMLRKKNINFNEI